MQKALASEEANRFHKAECWEALLYNPNEFQGETLMAVKACKKENQVVMGFSSYSERMVARFPQSEIAEVMAGLALTAGAKKVAFNRLTTSN